jgi:hypothetical protein
MTTALSIQEEEPGSSTGSRNQRTAECEQGRTLPRQNTRLCLSGASLVFGTRLFWD